ncbi:MAG TPA: hypothetical protein VGD76_05705 [Ramlibacter sp.]
MKRLASAKFLLTAAVAFAAFAAVSTAQARTDVTLSIGIPFGYVQPAPVYVQPAPVYYEPQPVYVQPRPVYVQPRPVYVQPRPIYYHDDHHRGHKRRGPWGDADRDGVPNRYDDAPRNPYRH